MLQKLLGKTWRTMPVWARRGVIRLTQPTFTVSAGVVVFDDANRVLLLNHVLRPASGWGVPGGFLDAGEQPAETARREVFEETGLKLENVELIRAQTVSRHVEFWFRGRANGVPEVKTAEILEARWFRLEEMPPEMSKSDCRLIEETFKAGENGGS